MESLWDGHSRSASDLCTPRISKHIRFTWIWFAVCKKVPPASLAFSIMLNCLYWLPSVSIPAPKVHLFDCMVMLRTSSHPCIHIATCLLLARCHSILSYAVIPLTSFSYRGSCGVGKDPLVPISLPVRRGPYKNDVKMQSLLISPSETLRIMVIENTLLHSVAELLGLQLALSCLLPRVPPEWLQNGRQMTPR